MKTWALAVLFLAGLGVSAATAAETQSVRLDELDVACSTCGYRETARNLSVDGHPLRLRGQTYAHGIGTHPPGSFRIDLAGAGVRFEATVGIDDEVGAAGSAEFRVLGDGRLLWSSGVLRGGGDLAACRVPLGGVRILELVVDTTPDGFGCDHTDWAEARIEYAGARPAALAVPKRERAYAHRWPPAGQVFEAAALPDPSDRDEADAVLRRSGALLAHLATLPGGPDRTALARQWEALRAQARRVEPADAEARAALLEQACRLRREIAFSNPLLDFDRILFIKRHFCPDSEMTGNHMCDQFFGFNAIRGGGLFVLERPFSAQPAARDLLADSVCGNGRFQGRRLTGDGGFLSPELSFDGREVLFAWTEIAEREGERQRYRQWTEHNTYKIFGVRADGGGLAQLTDGPWNDFDPCWLPGGRIAFISERRGGYGRCHGRPVPSYTLHAMDRDGGRLVMLSPHETNEWQPSVDRDGMIVYTRWDYVDRGFNQAHHPWTTTPDGRDPRVVHGNYAADRGGSPQLEISVRAVPGSRKLMAVAACHHGQAYGSVVLIDPSVPDDNRMGPVRRLTPDQGFPETEIGTHGDPACYGTPWPLSEHFFLCVYDAGSRSDAGTNNNYGIYLADAFGNRELLYRDPAISCLDPIPLRPRPAPPVIPDQLSPTNTEAFGIAGVANVYESLRPWPAGVRIARLRIVQLLAKTTPSADSPRIGYGHQKSARMVLGTVPVAEDGSACFKLPANRPVYLQALDADGLAVQSMRSATYVHPGETLVCRGCHDPRSRTIGTRPLALRRTPSEITPEAPGSRPFSFPLLVQPVLDRQCVACHERGRAGGKPCPDLSREIAGGNEGGWFNSYLALRPQAFFWDDAVFDRQPDTIPGKFGARQSRLYPMLAGVHHDMKLPAEDLHRIALWLDCNSDFYGSYENLEEQREGKVVWPRLE